ncbi:hypothetical protein [Ruminococcus sp. AM31-15AC]|uniref:hypothetical protein n=1 Tax=Ruminococcus sp. AM31-15AC TaxID=2293202 RepID=UPI000E4EC513|nr:hypothetical protein DW793_11815 [Ruminococcus sp. AM31-15AC]
MISDYIRVSKGFQSSINIEYDFNDQKIIDGFIPTNACLDIIDNIFDSVKETASSKAKILTGAYGRGKSLCVLIALSLLFNADKNLFSRLLPKIKRCNCELHKKIDNYLSSNKRLLPVIINGNSGKMSQAFLSALQRALNVYNFNDIMPETYFDSAIRTINMWKDEYPETYTRFTEKIGMNAEVFINRLSENDAEAYNTFTTLHPQLTSGSVFNPFVDSSIIDIYDKVNAELKKKGFAGIFVVYDEFGKYLESNITTASESETKMLQDFAEKCCRESSQQLYLMLICHKDISNYIDMNLSQDKVDGWRGISGRFEHINLTNNFSQMYEIISHTIKHKKGWNGFRENNAAVFDDLYKAYDDNSLIKGKQELVIDGCYPLHPVTTFILPRLSERVAQNERTLFTFLSSSQKNTLSQFINRSNREVPFITPDYLYDYFEDEFRKELTTSEIYKVYSLSSRILRSFKSDTLEAKIIKTIAVIHFIQQFERLTPTTDVICTIFAIDYDSKQVTDCIKELISEQYILYRKSSNGFLCLKETSGININDEIEKRIASIKRNKNNQEIISEGVGERYYYPTAYNDDNCITRYFKVKFVDIETYIADIKEQVPSETTGIIYAVFPTDNIEFNEFSSEVQKYLSENQRHITIIPSAQISVTKIIIRYLAISELRSEAVDDHILYDEYTLYLDDHSDIVSDFINSYLSPELHRATYYYKGKALAISRKSQLSSLLSQICNEIYTRTPIINNESLNKDRLSGVAVNSRTKIITALLENDRIEENLGLKGTGQDVSFMRSALLQTGILKKNDIEYYLDLAPEDVNLKYVLNTISDFFKSTISGEKTFSELYYDLTAPENNIGLKKGVIPIFIGIVLHSVKKDLIFKMNGEEIRLTADLLNAINDKPYLYSVQMEDWDDNKTQYLTQLKTLFADHVEESERASNSFAFILNAINRWYLTLPKCSRDMQCYYSNGKKIPKTVSAFPKSLKKPNINSRDYLLAELPAIFNQEIGSALAKKIKEAKSIFDGGKADLTKYVIITIKNTFGNNDTASLQSILNEWYEKLDETTIQHLFDNNENSILNLIESVNSDEKTFAERIGKALTGLKLNDWNNSTAAEFQNSLQTFKETIERYNTEEHDYSNSSASRFKMTFVGEDGKEIERSFDKVEYSSRANLLYEDITAAIDEMGQSISENEKRQILIDILKKMCL